MAAFALTPQVNDIIDYDTATGIKLHEKVTAAFKHAFDHKEGHTVIFSLQIKKRAEEMGWCIGQGDILTVKDSKGIDRNLITEYGQLTECH